MHKSVPPCRNSEPCSYLNLDLHLKSIDKDFCCYRMKKMERETGDRKLTYDDETKHYMEIEESSLRWFFMD